MFGTRAGEPRGLTGPFCRPRTSRPARRQRRPRSSCRPMKCRLCRRCRRMLMSSLGKKRHIALRPDLKGGWLMHRNAVVLGRVFAGGVLLLALAASPLHAQFAVSANDGKVRLVDGKVEVLKDGKDTVAFIDLAASPPKVVAEIEAPASVVGPPTSVAVAPNATFALVTAAMQVDPADPTKQIPDDKVTVID